MMINDWSKTEKLREKYAAEFERHGISRVVIKE